MAEEENVASSAGDPDNEPGNSPYDRAASEHAYQSYMDGQVQPTTLHQQSAVMLAERASRNELPAYGAGAMQGLDETQKITFNESAML